MWWIILGGLVCFAVGFVAGGFTVIDRSSWPGYKETTLYLGSIRLHSTITKVK